MGSWENRPAFAGLQSYSSDVGTLTPFYSGTSSDSYSFYYGVNVSTAKTPGTYTGEVLYTVLMDEACTKYTLNFNGNSATTNNLTAMDLDFDSTINLADISSTSKIARTGYTLSGWKDQDGNTYGATGEVDINPNDLAAVTLTAEWEANTYTIDYAAGNTGGTCSISSTLATYDTDVTLSSTKCTKTGYDQDGWSTSDSASNTKAYDLGATLTTPNFTSVADGTYTLYPHFVSTSVSVTVSGGIIGASGSTTTGTYNPGTSITITANSPSTGYHFTSWSSNNGGSFANSSSSQTTFTVPSGVASVTVTASTARNTYTIYYNANGGSGTTSSQSVTYNGGNVTLRANNFTRSGYTFQGWSRSSGTGNTVHYNASTAYSINTLASNAGVTNTNGATINLYAVWKEDACTITTTTSCKLKDNKTWIYGNSGNTVTWSSLCASSDDCRSSTYCPSGYSIPTKAIYDSLVSAQGSGSQLYSVLGFSGIRNFWSSTQSPIGGAYSLRVSNTGADPSYTSSKSHTLYVLCYK